MVNHRHQMAEQEGGSLGLPDQTDRQEAESLDPPSNIKILSASHFLANKRYATVHSGLLGFRLLLCQLILTLIAPVFKYRRSCSNRLWLSITSTCCSGHFLFSCLPPSIEDCHFLSLALQSLSAVNCYLLRLIVIAFSFDYSKATFALAILARDSTGRIKFCDVALASLAAGIRASIEVKVSQRPPFPN